MQVEAGASTPRPFGDPVVVVDQLGAGPGEWVIFAHGSRVRDLTVGPGVCDKDIVIAIVAIPDGLRIDAEAASHPVPSGNVAVKGPGRA